MNSDWIGEEFPGIDHKVTSEQDNSYNCIAWAAGFNDGWWSHKEGYHWIGERGAGIHNLIGMFGLLGYAECDSDAPEAGYEKVALYAKDGTWTHAARQLESGAWTSKLGIYEDIEHGSPQDLRGDLYGEVHCVMRKRIADAFASTEE